MVRSITFDGVNSKKDYDVIITNATIGFPAKVKNRIRIPNTNVFYDYAELFGDQYEERTLEYTFGLLDHKSVIGRADLQHKKMLLANWLMPGAQHKLEDSNISGYYFLAEVQEAPKLEDLFLYGELTVQFTCYPYKIGNHLEGDDVWDEIDFDTDVLQNLDFIVDGFHSATIYNISAHNISPKIIVTGNVNAMLHGTIFNFTDGVFANVGVVLNRDENIVYLSGRGTIRFEFRKEVL